MSQTIRDGSVLRRGLPPGAVWGVPVVLVLTVAWATAATAQAPSTVPPLSFNLQEAQARAVQQILVSFRSRDGYIRANAIEAAEALPRRIGPLAGHGLADSEPAVRFTAATIVGKLRLLEVAPAVRNLLNDPNESVRGAAVFALARCYGTDPRRNPQAVDLSPLAAMIGSRDPTTRANVAMLLGLLGDKSAVPLMKEVARNKIPRVAPEKSTLINLQVAEAVVKLGDEESIDAIRSGAFSQFDEVRVLSVQMLGRLQDRQFESAIVQMLDRPPVELQLAAAGTLARLGRQDGLPVALKAAQSDMPTARQQAAMTLGIFRGSPPAMQMLHHLLVNDPAEQVRIAAAAGLLGGGRDGL